MIRIRIRNGENYPPQSNVSIGQTFTTKDWLNKGGKKIQIRCEI
jgi:hypothetical protein